MLVLGNGVGRRGGQTVFTCPSFPCFFGIPCFLPLRGIPFFLGAFSLLLQGFWVGRDKKSLFFLVVFRPIFPKKQGKEGQGKG